ncbi:Estradiol 17-beta-dehydrogenase [Sphingobium chlorophenolicum L-1]|uniref:Estradiol 17-beta-dehydrogenase n=1 Tax=Sphingobium chlorophenolicum L-1 TaxID=690566 RepID=F6F3A1_SPHCR|nr:SDR family oxidoreductase [Sphingobium chlorophenolicum]AEG50913.1 Estradiol 17-beta-dehydrogenase [Sphingobium chlorophenolicum L-1]
MTEVQGRTAFITGGAHGIGLGIARALAADGVKVALADLDANALSLCKAELASITEVETVRLDVRDRQGFVEAIDHVEESLGPVTLLINNAGVAGSGDIDDLDYALWEWNIGINLWGVINGIQSVLPRMRARGLGGHVINTASASGLVGGTATMAYCTAKAGVVGLSESLRTELKGSGIGVSVLCPGPVATSILTHSAENLASVSVSRPVPSAERRDAQMSNVLEKAIQPDEVGRRVLAAIRANQFYIHTDRVMLQALEDRHREIVDAMPDEEMSLFTAELSAAFSRRRAS